MEAVALCLSAAALIVSGYGIWLTYLRAGTIELTQPAVVYFGPDKSTSRKVFLRGLLWSTGARGKTIEHMYVRVYHEGSVELFTIWVYGDKQCVRGSGLNIPPDGFVTDHHFLPTEAETKPFAAGHYKVEVYAVIVGDTNPKCLETIEVDLKQADADLIQSKGRGIYFDWHAERREYVPHVDLLPVLELTIH